MSSNPQQTTPSGRRRARALGIPLDGRPGPNNAITDVAGVEVGYSTIIRGEGPLTVGHGPVRTGVTAILPRGHGGLAVPAFAGSFSLNGNGELTGTIWIEESGQCEGPITITNTHSCGLARDATLQWLVQKHPDLMPQWGLPVAGETYDGELNDINGFHVTAEHVFEALDKAAPGPIELGSVGGGTGMICYEFKAGSGSASRLVDMDAGGFTVGVFVQANFGRRGELIVAGIPVGRELTGGEVRSKPGGPGSSDLGPGGSVIAIVATDAPLLSHQLKRLARRVGLGLARSGAVAHNGSGDIFLAFSTANGPALEADEGPRQASFLSNEAMDPLFTAVVEAVDEAVLDSMVANEAMVGRDGIEVPALPHDRLCAILERHGRLAATDGE